MQVAGDEALYALLDGQHFEGFLWCKLICAEVLQGLRFREDICIMEDVVLLCDCFHRGASIYYCHTPLYYYRVHPDKLINSRYTPRKSTELLAAENIPNMAKSYNASLYNLAIGRYCNTAARLCTQAHAQGDSMAKHYKAAARIQLQTCLRAMNVPLKQKGKVLLRLYFLRISLRLQSA